ncbi:hypothetical protein G9A89_021193 [Geosiphon pyriformis]|nr:hypothetical protein G9A89_021193 [Geosiphon pyriformis]
MFGVDKLIVAVIDISLVVVADKLFGTAVNKLVVGILTVDKLTAVSLAELGTGNWGFNIDFPINGYLNADNSQFGYVFVYHNSSKYMSLVATIDWSMKMNMVDSGGD